MTFIFASNGFKFNFAVKLSSYTLRKIWEVIVFILASFTECKSEKIMRTGLRLPKLSQKWPTYFEMQYVCGWGMLNATNWLTVSECMCVCVCMCVCGLVGRICLSTCVTLCRVSVSVRWFRCWASSLASWTSRYVTAELSVTVLHLVTCKQQRRLSRLFVGLVISTA